MIGSLFFLTAIFFVNFTARVILAPLLPALETDLHLSHGQAGTLFLFIAAGYFIALLGSGHVSARVHHKTTIVLSVAATGLSFLGLSLSQALWQVCLGVFVMGVASGLYLPSGMATLTSLFGPEHWGKAIAVHEIAPNLAFATAPLIADLLLVPFTWRGAVAVLGALTILTGLAYGALAQGGKFSGEPPALSFLASLLRERLFWLMLLLFSLGIGASMGTYSMLPLFLVYERGMDQNWANTIISLSRLPPLAGALASGWLVDRLGSRRTMCYVLAATGLAGVMLGIGPKSWTVAMVFLQAILVGCFFPAALAELSSIGSTANRNVVVSFTIPFAYLAGAGGVPTLIGYLGEEGFFGWGICLVGALMLCGAAVCSMVGHPNPRPPKSTD